MLVAVLLWLVAFATVARAQDSPYFEAVGDADSIADGVVTALAEDRAGFLWIGTTNGLIRYDGYRLRRFASAPDAPGAIGGNLVRGLLATRDGRLWAGTDIDGVAVYDPQTDRFRNFRHDPGNPASLIGGQLFALAEAPDGRVWVGSRNGGLDRIDPVTGAIAHMRDTPGLHTVEVNALLFDRAGTLWIGSTGGLLRFDLAQLRVERSDALPAVDPRHLQESIYSLFESSDGALWAGTREGSLLRVDRGSNTIVAAEAAENAVRDGSTTVFALAEPRPGQLWIGRTNGVEIRAADGRLLRRLRHDPAIASSLAGDDVRALLVDRAGQLWAGGFGSGLQRHDPNNDAIHVLRGQPGFGGVLAVPSIAALLAEPDGSVWVGARGAGLARLDPSLQLVDGIRPGDPASGLKAGWISALARTTDGALWLGSRDGAHRRDPASGRFVVHDGERGLPNQSVRRLLATADGALWAGTGNGVFRLPAGSTRFAPVMRADGGPLAGDINAFAVAPDGRIWVGGVRGLFLIEPGEPPLLHALPASAALAHPTVLGLLLDRDGVLWVDTPAGLHRRLDGEPLRFESISARHGVGGTDYGANLLQDAQGRIWSHRYVYDPATDTLQALTRTDGVDFGTGWFRSYTALPDGRLLFGGSEGLLVIDPARFRPWSYAPPLVISEVRIGSQPVLLEHGALTLGPAQRSFSVEFAALDFSAPQRNRYAYRLHGFDEHWIDTGAAYRVAQYSNLWPGRYTLQMRGSNRNGVFSPQQLEIPVTVLPAWWQTSWFALLALIAAAALVLAGVRWRTARIRRQAERLQSLVEQRTAELSLAKQRAETALDDLRGTQSQLIASEKMASLGQLVAGVAHEINTPIGIAITALSHMQEVTRGSRAKLDAGGLTRGDLRQWQDTIDEATRLIESSLGRAHELIGSFKRVAVDQSSEQRRRFELREFLHEVQFALQPSYRRTGHPLQVECAEGIVLDTFPGALFQIFTNLVTNSLMHAFDGHPDGSMQIVVEPHGERVRLRYRDSGRGMSAEVVARAFDPFFTTRRGSGGSGLGLHLVYNLVTRLLGGTIELHNTPGSGCEFIIDIPLSVAATTGQPAPAAV